jgi:hypothetical protein
MSTEDSTIIKKTGRLLLDLHTKRNLLLKKTKWLENNKVNVITGGLNVFLMEYYKSSTYVCSHNI